MNTKFTATLIALFLVLFSTSAFAQAVQITPSPAFSNNDLTCTIVGSNPAAWQYEWYLNGNRQSFNTNFVPNSATTHFDSWRCRMVMPTGTFGASVAVENTITIANTPPSVGTNGPYVGVEGATIINLIGTAVDLVDNDAVTGFLWNFGNGFTDVVQNPVYTYPQNGTFTVTFTATDAYGASNTTTTTAVINDTVPFVNFTITPASIIEGNSVNLDDLSTAYDGIVAWDWDVNADGSVEYTTQNATHLFAQNGTFAVNLTVTDADGSQSTGTQFITVNDTVPTADAGIDQNVIEGNAFNFDGSLSTAYDMPMTFNWTYLGSTIATGMTPAYTFVQNGTYDVVLYVTDADGSVANDTVQIVVNDTVPTADAGLDQTVVEGNAVTFDGSLSTAYDVPLTYNWTLSNGTVIGTTVSPMYTFVQNGTYDVLLTVTDADGSMANDTVQIVVNDTTPFANFTASTLNTVAGTQINFTDLSTAYDQPSSYNWDFGDLSTATTTNATHTYAAAGNYTVTLTVTDADGSVNATAQNITITTSPDVTAPANISGLTATAITNQSITWNWTNPTDVDFANAIVYFDGVNVLNTTAQAYVANGLLNNTAHTISIYTIDTAGNINITPVNSTVTTLQNAAPGNVAPVVTLVSPLNNQNFTINNVTLNYTVSDDASATLACTLNLNAVANATHPAVANGTTDGFDLFLLADGTYTWDVTCTDGSLSNTSVTQSFNVNTTAPAVHDISVATAYINTVNGIRITNATAADDLANPANLTNDQIYSLRFRQDNLGSVSESWTANITIYNATGSSVYSNTHSHTAAPGTGPVDTDAWNTIGLPVGQYTITVNTTITGFTDSNTADNFRTRVVNVVSSGAPADTTAPIITNVMNGTISNTTAVVAWNTNETSNTSVNYGTTVSLGTISAINDAVVNHTQALTGLTASTLYYYNVTSCDPSGNCATSGLNNFTTAATPVAPLFNIVNSWVNGSFYVGTNTLWSNINAASIINQSNISGVSPATFTVDIQLTNVNLMRTNVSNTYLTSVNATDSQIENSILSNGNVLRCFIKGYFGNNFACTDSILDPPTPNSNLSGSTFTTSVVMNSNVTNTVVVDSNISNSNVDQSNLNNVDMNSCTVTSSTVGNSNVTGTTTVNCNIANSNVQNSVVTASNITNGSTVTASTVTNSAVTNSQVTAGSTVTSSQVTNSNIANTTVTNSALNNVTATNSVITNTTLANMTVTSANISNGVLNAGNITLPNGTVYSGPYPVNVSAIVQSAPFFTSGPACVVTGLDIDCVATADDANIPAGDSITYAWTYGDSTGAAGNNPAPHTYASAGTRTVTLTVTDSTGLTAVWSAPFTTSSGSSSSGGSGGGNGGSSSSLTKPLGQGELIQGNRYVWDVEKDGNPWTKSIRKLDTIMFVYQGTTYSLFVQNIDADNKVTLRVSPTDEVRAGYKEDAYNFKVKDRTLLVINEGVTYEKLDSSTTVKLKLELTDAIAQDPVTPTDRIVDGVIKVMGEIAPPADASVPVGIGISAATIVLGLALFLGMRKIWN
ncbi:MAG TPA: PKD domain-containing protein [Candidatus Nanoarchaeia archaeon]|nr:PKD domain-containing protein [Candidatus Nanoarchaeia archaeon]